MAERPRGKPSDNIYTVLIGLALLTLICGIGYVWFRSYQLSGNLNPFQLNAGQQARTQTHRLVLDAGPAHSAFAPDHPAPAGRLRLK